MLGGCNTVLHQSNAFSTQFDVYDMILCMCLSELLSCFEVGRVQLEKCMSHACPQSIFIKILMSYKSSSYIAHKDGVFLKVTGIVALTYLGALIIM